jgi:integrase/recombinase XerD
MQEGVSKLKSTMMQQISKLTHQQINIFKNHLQTLGYGQSSISMLPTCLKSFFEYILKDVDQITPEDIINYYQFLQERPNQRRSGGLSESYIHHHIYALKLFFAWQMEIGKLTTNPISGLTFKPPTSEPRKVLNTEEIQRLYGACETLKERAVLGVFYGCGLRRSEGVKLNQDDVHFKNSLLYVREGKGSKRRVVPMSETIKQDFENYVLKERFGLEDEKAFICNRKGKRPDGNHLNKILKKLLERSRVDSSGISLHNLRHSIATHLLDSGLSVEYVRDFLGHKHLEATQVYTRITKKQLHEI